jgi:hypothetical protein
MTLCRAGHDALLPPDAGCGDSRSCVSLSLEGIARVSARRVSELGTGWSGSWEAGAASYEGGDGELECGVARFVLLSAGGALRG